MTKKHTAAVFVGGALAAALAAEPHAVTQPRTTTVVVSTQELLARAYAGDPWD